MRTQLLPLLFLIAALSAHAQVPGYMGKRMSVHFGAALGPALNTDYLVYDETELSSVNRYGVNTRLNAGIEYTLSKVVVGGLSYQYLPTKIPYGFYTVDLPENPAEIEYAGYFGDVDVKGNFGSVYFKFYAFQRKGSIAPVGKYHKLEVAYGFAKASTGGSFNGDETVAYYDGEYIPLKNFEDLNYQYDEPIIILMYSFGSETVYFDKLIGDFSVQVGVATSGAYNKENYGRSELEFEGDLLSRISGAYFFNINLGIGYFVF